MLLSVIIPAYNEEKRLPKTLEEIQRYLKQQSYQSEIIVVDGGSTDKTAKIVREWPQVKLIELKNSQGKGQAVKGGMLAAQGKFRIFTDADNSTSIEQVENMLPYFEQGYDVVIGSRDIEGAVLEPPQPFLRKMILGRGFRLLRKILAGFWDISDSQCGFKAFSGEAAVTIFPRLTLFGFSFDVEALVLAKKMGYKIKEIPVRWVNDPESKVKFKDIIKMLLELIKIRLNLIKGLYD